MDAIVFMMGFSVKNPWYFFVPAGAFVAYVLYLMVSGRREESPKRDEGGPEL